MDNYMQVLQNSVNFPKGLKFDEQTLLWFPVSADSFKTVREELVIMSHALESMCYVAQATDENQREYALLMLGERRQCSTFLKDCSICTGLEDCAFFTDEQFKHAKRAYRESAGEVVYAHSHVTRGDNYKCFSVNDLRFLVERAMLNKRDVYGMLIVNEGAVAIKYSLKDNEFFKVRIVTV